MKDMIANIRSTGFDGVVVIPGNEQGQSEKAVLAQGKVLLDWDSRHNLLFDVHAYEGWLIGNTTEQIEARIAAVKSKGVALYFGEVGPINAGTLMDTASFLTAARRRDVSVTAWLWKQDANDKDALQDASGNTNKNNWGSLFHNFALAPRSLRPSVSAASECAGRAANNDWDTYWSTGPPQQPGQAFVIGLGLGKSFNYITLWHGNRPDDYPRGWKLYTSNDGSNWTYKTGGSRSRGTTNIWPGPQWSRWVKIEQTGSAGNYWSIAELAVTQD